MRLILLLLVALVAGAVIYPRTAEHTDTVCAAFEHQLGAVAAQQAALHNRNSPPGIPQGGVLGFLQGAVAGSQGQIAAAYIRDRYPQLPPFVGCTVGYWRLNFDPDLTPLLRDVIQKGK